MSVWRKIPATFWQLLTVTLLGVPLITPLLQWTAVACTHDGHLHYHRVAALRHAWENGIYFTRWLPDLAFGYGYPFFVYREPAPLYAVLLPHLLGLPLPAAENLFYAVCILAGGWFMFLWARDIFGARAGIISALAYMTAPYVLVDALVRGNAPESLALPLLPLLLWVGRRWLLTGKTRWFLTAVFSLSLLALSHNISLLIFTPTLLVYLAALAYLHQVKWRTAVARITLLLALGLGMTLFYAGGAVLEMDAVTLDQSTSTRNNDFHYNFATLGEILAPVAPEDPTLLNPPLLFRLGWVTTGLAIWGALGWFGLRKRRLILHESNSCTVSKNIQRRGAETQRDHISAPLRLRVKSFDSGLSGDWRLESDNESLISNLQSLKEQQWHIGLMVLATAVYLFMSLSVSLPVWENVPLIDFAQFPWRFVGRAALPIALLAGVPFACQLSITNYQLPITNHQPPATNHRSPITDHRLRILFFLAIPLLILEAIPNLYPNQCRENPFPTILTVHQYEHETGLVGVDPEGSYFPRTVEKRPKESPLEADYLAGQMPQRFDARILPAGATIDTAVNHPLATTLTLTSPEPFTAVYLAFAFPGWQAAVDGQPVVITPSQPDGLITFPVPAGTHAVDVSWGSTPLRNTLTAVSLLAFMSTIILAIFSKRLSVFGNRLLPHPPNCLPITDYRLLITLALLMLAFKLLVDRTENPLRRSTLPTVAETAVLQGGEWRLNGYNLSRTQTASGGTFDIDLAWTAVDVPRAPYQSNVWLAGPDGLLWSEKETFRTRQYEDAPPVISWQPGQWGWDSREVQVLPGTPPGLYDIVLTLFDRETLQPVTLLDENGQVVGPTAVLGQMEVTLPDESPDFAPQVPLETAVPSLGWTLLGFSQDREEAAPGDPFLLTLFWERGAGPAGQFHLALQDEAGQVVREWELPFTATAVPPLTLPNRERIRSQHLLRLPVDLQDGRFQFVLAYDVPLGDVALNAPERILEQPEVDTAVNIPFSHDATQLTTLIGYTLDEATCHLPLATCHLSLLWRADAVFPASYRVFVHLVDETGQIIAQADGEPANWIRPTTGWMPSEYILDTHTLTLPATLPNGPLTLRVGLYDPETGGRLQTDTADYIPIPLP